jgi:hypothetical protein
MLLKPKKVEFSYGATNYRRRRRRQRRRRKMEEFMLDEKNIAEVIKSREDLTASGIDGISSRIMKGAGAE